MKSHVLVIGGGFAGLRAAVGLADAGLRVTLLEGRNGLGGRARSFSDPATGDRVDNGQHLFLAGYHRTLAFLDRLGTRDRVVFQDRLRVCFARPGGRIEILDCPEAVAPWHLVLGLLRFPGFPLSDKLRLRRVWNEIQNPNGSSAETVEQWLARLGQGEKSRACFWDPLTIAALNEDPARASSAGLRQVLGRMMAGPWQDSRLGMAVVGLTELYGDRSKQIIEEKGGEVFLNCPVVSLEIENGKVKGAGLAGGRRLCADAVICAVPPAALLKLLTESTGYFVPGTLVQNLRKFSSSPILSVNLWLDRPVSREPFVALIGRRFQWLFNKQAMLRSAGLKAGYVSLIASAAYNLLDQPNEKLVRAALEDLQACFPKFGCLSPSRSQVVRERDATVSLTPETEKLRPGPKTSLSNLFLAGDWTATGLPATLESAVLSGESAAEAALNLPA